MNKSTEPLLSVVVPLYNEDAGLQVFHESLINTLEETTKNSYEVIYCDDGSTDGTDQIVRRLSTNNSRIKLIRLSRNFGKEYALSAGIAEANGQAIIMLDGDGQHPVEMIPQFVKAWQKGAQVVIGVRSNNSQEVWTKRVGSRAFYSLFNKLTGQQLLAGSTDFRLISKPVQQAFLKLQETDRITRGLIDWLGFKRELIYFKPNVRQLGPATYSRSKLLGLAANSFVSLTPKPLYIFGSLGVFITIGSFILGVAVIIEQLILNDPWHWKFSGTSMLGILILFLVGILLMSQGILSLYISHMNNQSKGRPLYIIDHSESIGISNDTDV
jgi:glycosyltransferase involved in cell wall biosynthesis